MGLNKIKSVGQSVPSLSPLADKPESGTEAAIGRLLSTKDAIERLTSLPGGIDVAESRPVPKYRDFDAEARGKTRCVQFEAALQSPAIAGMKWSTMEEYLRLVRQAADAGVAYTFEDR